MTTPADGAGPFAVLLQQHRQAAGLSQEELAERAGLSARGISDLERGVRRSPYPITVRALAKALGLDTAAQATLLAAIRPRTGAPETPGSTASLPIPLSSFVGREREVAEIRRLLATTRLLTLTGTGGIGKTRLALQVATELCESYPHGVCLVELAPLADPALLSQAVATATGVREQLGRPVQQTLAEALRDRHLLLVLDNCEHLVEACAELAEALLRTCPNLSILATSREILRIAGETAWRVPPLGLPPLMPAGPSSPTDPSVSPLCREQVEDSEAVRLFVARAAAVRPGFVLTDDNAAMVARICHQLDGLPLAIELAAPRVSTLGLEQLAGRLADRFRVLTGGSRTALPRHQTLRATLEWSYALLPEPEQRLFERLAVFAGGWTLETAEAVGGGDGIDSADVLELLMHLVDKSLVVTEEGLNGEARYRLLETLREYGWECLARSGAADAAQRRHLAFFLALAERAEPEVTGAAQEVWLGRLEQEHDNLRAALQWTIECGEAELGLRLAGALGQFWRVHGHYSEGRRWLNALPTVAGSGGAAIRAKALSGAGELAIDQGEYSRATALLEDSLALFRELGDTGGIAWSLFHLGRSATYTGDYIRATALSEEALGLFRELGDKGGIAWSLVQLGLIAADQSDYSLAMALLEEGLGLFRNLRAKQGIAYALLNLGRTASEQGEYGRATALLGESLALCRDLGDKRGSAVGLNYLGSTATYQGDYGRATALFEEGLALFRDLGAKRGMALGIERLAVLACAQEHPERAARLFGAAQGMREAIGAPRPPNDQTRYDRSVTAARVWLGEDAFAAAWADGRALAPEQALRAACSGAEPPARWWDPEH